MKLIGLMPCRNEAWCIGLTLRAALMWCDEVVVLLHECDDDSQDIICDVISESGDEAGDERITLIYEDGPWDKMRHPQRMLDYARARGATHIAMIDADEILTGDRLRGARIYAEVPPEWLLILPLYNLGGELDRYHTNGLWGNRTVSVTFADRPELGWAGDDCDSREPQGVTLESVRPIALSTGGVMHLRGANIDRWFTKHRLYKIMERIRQPQKDSRAIEQSYGEDPTTWTYNPVPLEWWAPYVHLLKYLDIHGPDWQDAECDRLIAEYGRDYFLRG
jgi:Glycosyl transferase family 2